MGRSEGALDPAAGPVQQLAHDLRGLRHKAGSPTYRVMAAGSTCSASTLAQAASGRVLPSLPVVLAYVAACGGDRQEWEPRWEQVARELAQRLPDDGADPPYRGLARFGPGDRELFFGRDELVGQVVELVGRRRFSALVGASGSGKSSLLRAGLVPALRDQPEGAPRLAAVRIVTPGGRPASDHAARLTVEPGSGDGDVLVVVDQFEEVFTLCHDPAERDRFLDLLLGALNQDSRLRVVIAVRADFFGHCARHPGLAAALRDASVLVGPMGAAELREAVVKPAAAAGLIVERSLTARIVAETVQEPGGLPLMSHALLETWRRRRGRALTEQMYEAAGGIHGAVAATAEDLYHRLTPSQADTARRILLRLITPGEGAHDTRRPTDRAELDAASPEAADVLEQLVRARLLTLDRDTVDLAHEALITAWPRYRAWIEEDRERLRLHRRLTEAAGTWEDHDRDPGALYRGIRLTAAADAFTEKGRESLTPLESAFLDAGERTRDQEARASARTARRFRTLTATLSVLLALAVVTSLVAWNQSRASDRSRHTAQDSRQVALSRQLAAQSNSLIGTDTDLASLLAVQAYRISPTAEATAGLYLAAAVPLRQRTVTPDRDAITALDFDPHGRTLAWGTGYGTVQTDSTASGRPLTITAGHSHGVRAIAFRPDGRTLVTSDVTGAIRTTNLATDRSRVPIYLGWQVASQLGSDGKTLITFSNPYSSNRSFALWDTATGRIRKTVPMQELPADTPGAGEDAPQEWDPISSPDGRLLATPRTTGAALWDTANGRTLGVVRAGQSVVVAAFSPDGHVLATGTSNGRVQIWDTASGRLTATFLPPENSDAAVRTLAFHPNGHLLAIGTDDGTVSLWDTDTRHTAAVFNGHQSAVTALAFSPDGRLLASGSYDVRLWDTTPVVPYATLTHIKAAASESPLTFLPDEKTVATTADDGTVRLFGTRSGASVATLGSQAGDCDFITSSSDGRHLATLGDDGVVHLVDTTTGKALVLPGTDSISALTVAFSPDGRYLAVSDALYGLRTWDTATGRSRSFPLLFFLARQLAFSPDGRTLAAGDAAGAVQLMDASTGRLQRRWSVSTLSQPRVPPHQRVMVFSPDGSTLATGDLDGGTRLWDVATGRTRAVLSVSASPVTSVAFSTDGHTLATAGLDGKARLWDVSTGKVRATLTTGDTPLTSVDFSPDGRTLATIGRQGTAWLWHLDLPDPDDVAASICTALRGGLTMQQHAQYLPGVPASFHPACPAHDGG